MGRPRTAPVSPQVLDLGTLALFVGQLLADVVLQALHRRGFDGLRVAHGFVFQHFVEAPRSIGELAERMGVTQQAASKSVAELVRLGYLERAPDDDARVRRIRLSRRGRAAIETARTERAGAEARVAQGLGALRFEATRSALAELLDQLGGADAVRARRVRAPR